MTKGWWSLKDGKQMREPCKSPAYCPEGISGPQQREEEVRKSLVGFLCWGDGDKSSERSRQIGFTGQRTREKRDEQKGKPKTSRRSRWAWRRCWWVWRVIRSSCRWSSYPRPGKGASVRIRANSVWCSQRAQNNASFSQTGKPRDVWSIEWTYSFCFNRGKN